MLRESRPACSIAGSAQAVAQKVSYKQTISSIYQNPWNVARAVCGGAPGLPTLCQHHERQSAIGDRQREWSLQATQEARRLSSRLLPPGAVHSMASVRPSTCLANPKTSPTAEVHPNAITCGSMPSTTDNGRGRFGGPVCEWDEQGQKPVCRASVASLRCHNRSRQDSRGPT